MDSYVFVYPDAPSAPDFLCILMYSVLRILMYSYGFLCIRLPGCAIRTRFFMYSYVFILMCSYVFTLMCSSLFILILYLQTDRQTGKFY